MTQVITVYSKPNCMQCNYTKKWLDDNHIDYIAIDVTEHENALAYVKHELGYQSLPVVEVSGQESWFGFRPERLEELK